MRSRVSDLSSQSDNAASFNNGLCMRLDFIEYITEFFISLWRRILLACVITVTLTHWGRDTMDAISQTTFANAFSWMKMFKFLLKFHWSLFLRAQLTIFQHWFRWWLGADQATSHYLNQWWLNYWRIYASLGLNELSSIHSLLSWITDCSSRTSS